MSSLRSSAGPQHLDRWTTRVHALLPCSLTLGPGRDAGDVTAAYDATRAASCTDEVVRRHFDERGRIPRSERPLLDEAMVSLLMRLLEQWRGHGAATAYIMRVLTSLASRAEVEADMVLRHLLKQAHVMVSEVGVAWMQAARLCLTGSSLPTRFHLFMMCLNTCQNVASMPGVTATMAQRVSIASSLIRDIQADLPTYTLVVAWLMVCPYASGRPAWLLAPRWTHYSRLALHLAHVTGLDDFTRIIYCRTARLYSGPTPSPLPTRVSQSALCPYVNVAHREELYRNLSRLLLQRCTCATVRHFMTRHHLRSSGDPIVLQACVSSVVTLAKWSLRERCIEASAAAPLPRTLAYMCEHTTWGQWVCLASLFHALLDQEILLFEPFVVALSNEYANTLSKTRDNSIIWLVTQVATIESVIRVLRTDYVSRDGRLLRMLTQFVVPEADMGPSLFRLRDASIRCLMFRAIVRPQSSTSGPSSSVTRAFLPFQEGYQEEVQRCRQWFQETGRSRNLVFHRLEQMDAINVCLMSNFTARYTVDSMRQHLCSDRDETATVVVPGVSVVGHSKPIPLALLCSMSIRARLRLLDLLIFHVIQHTRARISLDSNNAALAVQSIKGVPSTGAMETWARLMTICLETPHSIKLYECIRRGQPDVARQAVAEVVSHRLLRRFMTSHSVAWANFLAECMNTCDSMDTHAQLYGTVALLLSKASAVCPLIVAKQASVESHDSESQPLRTAPTTSAPVVTDHGAAVPSIASGATAAASPRTEAKPSPQQGEPPNSANTRFDPALSTIIMLNMSRYLSAGREQRPFVVQQCASLVRSLWASQHVLHKRRLRYFPPTLRDALCEPCQQVKVASVDHAPGGGGGGGGVSNGSGIAASQHSSPHHLNPSQVRTWALSKKEVLQGLASSDAADALSHLTELLAEATLEQRAIYVCSVFRFGLTSIDVLDNASRVVASFPARHRATCGIAVTNYMIDWFSKDESHLMALLRVFERMVWGRCGLVHPRHALIALGARLFDDGKASDCALRILNRVLLGPESPVQRQVFSLAQRLRETQAVGLGHCDWTHSWQAAFAQEFPIAPLVLGDLLPQYWGNALVDSFPAFDFVLGCLLEQNHSMAVQALVRMCRMVYASHAYPITLVTQLLYCYWNAPMLQQQPWMRVCLLQLLDGVPSTERSPWSPAFVAYCNQLPKPEGDTSDAIHGGGGGGGGGDDAHVDAGVRESGSAAHTLLSGPWLRDLLERVAHFVYMEDNSSDVDDVDGGGGGGIAAGPAGPRGVPHERTAGGSHVDTGASNAGSVPATTCPWATTGSALFAELVSPLTRIRSTALLELLAGPRGSVARMLDLVCDPAHGYAFGLVVAAGCTLGTMPLASWEPALSGALCMFEASSVLGCQRAVDANVWDHIRTVSDTVALDASSWCVGSIQDHAPHRWLTLWHSAMRELGCDAVAHLASFATERLAPLARSGWQLAWLVRFVGPMLATLRAQPSHLQTLVVAMVQSVCTVSQVLATQGGGGTAWAWDTTSPLLACSNTQGSGEPRSTGMAKVASCGFSTHTVWGTTVVLGLRHALEVARPHGPLLRQALQSKWLPGEFAVID